jgi:hypothetical protein
VVRLRTDEALLRRCKEGVSKVDLVRRFVEFGSDIFALGPFEENTRKLNSIGLFASRRMRLRGCDEGSAFTVT